MIEIRAGIRDVDSIVDSKCGLIYESLCIVWVRFGERRCILLYWRSLAAVVYIVVLERVSVILSTCAVIDSATLEVVASLLVWL